MYTRVLIKLSGELLSGGHGTGISYPSVLSFAENIDKIYEKGIKVAVLVGGGNIVRGRDFSKKDFAHKAGMLSTVINSLMIRSAIKNPCKMLSSNIAGNVGELYSPEKAREYFNNNILVLAGGLGVPHFSTDTASVIRAIDIEADAVLKATKVDGVYNKDPVNNKDAEKYDNITFDEVIDKRIKIIDLTASVLASEKDIDFFIFNATNPENLYNACVGECEGTKIYS